MKKLLSAAVLFLLLDLPAEKLPETVARFGNITIPGSRFRGFDIPSEPGLRREALKKLVDTEVCLIITRQLLARSAIMPDEKTARRYVSMRRKEFPHAPAALLEQNISRQDFQLRSALYFTFLAADPALVEPSKEDVRSHYELNKEKFLRPVKSDLVLMRAGENTPEGRQKAALILSRLRQGEDFYALAKKFDPAGLKNKIPSPELRSYFRKVKTMAPGSSDAFETPKGIFIVKVNAHSPKEYRSFEEVRPWITEVLSSARLKRSLEQYMKEILAKTPVQYLF